MKDNDMRPGRNWDRNCFMRTTIPFQEMNELKTFKIQINVDRKWKGKRHWQNSSVKRTVKVSCWTSPLHLPFAMCQTLFSFLFKLSSPISPACGLAHQTAVLSSGNRFSQACPARFHFAPRHPIRSCKDYECTGSSTAGLYIEHCSH